MSHSLAIAVAAVFVVRALWHFHLRARAIGEFRYVGFFKRVVGSRFATLDTFVYSPLCLALAIGVALVARDSVA